VLARNGYEPAEYKAFTALFDQMRRSTEKTMANCRKSAHGLPMSEQSDGSVRRFAGLSP
jgi:hypothetical protein